MVANDKCDLSDVIVDSIVSVALRAGHGVR